MKSHHRVVEITVRNGKRYFKSPNGPEVPPDYEGLLPIHEFIVTEPDNLKTLECKWYKWKVRSKNPERTCALYISRGSKHCERCPYAKAVPKKKVKVLNFLAYRSRNNFNKQLPSIDSYLERLKCSILDSEVISEGDGLGDMRRKAQPKIASVVHH